MFEICFEVMKTTGHWAICACRPSGNYSGRQTAVLPDRKMPNNAPDRRQVQFIRRHGGWLLFAVGKRLLGINFQSARLFQS